jgi:hypothetical protein
VQHERCGWKTERLERGDEQSLDPTPDPL